MAVLSLQSGSAGVVGVKSNVLRIAWATILVAELGVLAYGVMLLATPEALRSGYLAFTGRDWSTALATNPETLGYILLLGRLIGVLNVAFAAMALCVLWFGFRKGEPWAWYALLIGNTLGYGGPIATDLTTGSIGIFEQVEIVLLAAVYVALAISAKSFLTRRT